MTSASRPPDEFANLATHGVGFLLSVVATGLLMQRAASSPPAVKIACAIYLFALLLVYGSSTLSHLFYDTVWRQRFRTLDQASIFLLIAGTYTPIAMTCLNHGWWHLVLIVMWLAACAGVWRVTCVRNLSATDKLFFGLMGFVPSVTLIELFRQQPAMLVIWLIAGGACYCVGTVFLQMSSRVQFSHAVWHLFVMAGSTCHFLAILLAVTMGH